jgi:hypothetical protein
MREFEGQLVPGLLQTEPYARAVLLAGTRALSATDTEARMAIRTKRQQLLEVDDPPELRIVLDEAVLWRRIGGVDVMVGQIEHLLAMGARPNIRIQLLPFGTGAHPALDGPFTLIDFPLPPDGYPDNIQPRLVYIESLMNAGYLEKSEEIIAYDEAWRDLCALAIAPDASAALLRTIADDLRKIR